MQFITGFVLLLVLGQCLAQTHPWDPQPRDADWLKKIQKLVNQTLEHKAEEQIIFIGDSITESWPKNGSDVWVKYYIPRHAYNYGIGGDETQHLLYRIQHKEFDGLNPKVAVLMIGTNNLNNMKAKAFTVEDIAKGVKEVLTELEVKMPSTKIILLGVLPRPEPTGAIVKQLNTLIAKFGDNNKVFWLDMWSSYESTDGKQKTELFQTDKTHLNLAGYEIWHKTMEPLLNKLDPTL